MGQTTERGEKIIQAIFEDDVTKLESLLPDNRAEVNDLYLVQNAAGYGSTKCLHFLINAKFDINQQLEDLQSQSPLHIAASSGQIECVQLLIDSGANTLQEDNFNKLALNYAISQNHIECAILIINTDAIKNALTDWNSIIKVFCIDSMYSSFTFFSVEHIPKEAAAKFLFLYAQAVGIDSAENIHQIDNEIQKKFQSLTEEKLNVSDLWQVFRETSEGCKMMSLMHPCKSARK